VARSLWKGLDKSMNFFLGKGDFLGEVGIFQGKKAKRTKKLPQVKKFSRNFCTRWEGKGISWHILKNGQKLNKN